MAPTIKGMIKRVKKGHTVLIPEGTRQGVHFVPATVAKLQAALAAAGATTAQPGAEVAGRLSAPGPDPHEFPIRGQGCHQVTWRKERYWAAWCKMPFEIVGEYCDIDGCKKTDTLKTRLKVNPGAKESRVSWSSTYTYQAHHRNFKHIHIEWWVLCFKDEKECGTGNTKELYGNSSGTFTPTSNRLLRNSRIRHAFILWAYFQPDGHWHSDEAKTWKGICKPKPSRQCLYPA